MFSLPTSHTQRRFWVLDQLRPGDPALNIAEQYALLGRLDVSALERAVSEIVDRHEILRATFKLVDSEVKQIVAPSLHVPLRLFTVEEEAYQDAKRPFDLSSDPLIRVGLLRVADLEHRLFITLHHIVADGWSLGVIIEELGLLYQAFVSGQPSPLHDLPIQYADYTIWERENRDQSAWNDAAKYWKQQLRGLPPFEIPPDMPRRGLTSEAGIERRRLPAELTGRLRDLGRRHESTLFMTMVASLAALLHRYTGEPDVVIGSQVAGRTLPDVEPLVGPFINTLILRTDLSGDPTFSELLVRVRGVISDAFIHQEYPFDKVVEDLQIERQSGRDLLFNINFVYQREFVSEWDFRGVSLRLVPSKSPGGLHDLHFSCVENAEGFSLSCEYSTALFHRQSIERMLEHFERLVAAILDEPNQRISGYRFLPPAEEQCLLCDWNRTAAQYPGELCVHELFEQQVDRTPNATAVTCGGESLSYRQLNARANQLARALGDAALVGVNLPRSLDMLTAVLAVLKVGAAYVPLDPSFPSERLAFMAEDSGLDLRLDDAWLAERRLSIGRQEATNLKDRAKPDSLAYVIYTSGSTGKPKGVEIHHRAFVNLLWAVLREPGVHANDTLLAITTLSFDIAGLELLAPLLAGGRILLATKEEASDGIALRNVLSNGLATILQATPATWRMLIEAGWSKSPGLKMLCGGEPLSRELADAMLERGGELWNMYGPTETTIWSSWRRIERGNVAITVGQPAPNQSFYVLDAHRHLMPIGMPGELYIGGHGVATGYRNRPGLTSERFLPNPFGEGRLYRTGDRARWRPGGDMEVLGRVDSQVKIRGFRIELGEVETALAACPEVRSAAVVVRGELLAGYFVPESEAEGLAEMIRERLKQRLPDYMIPAHLVPLVSLPMTPNGKIDRKALPDPQFVPSATVGLTEQPKDALETMLVGIWESVLNVRPIRPTDNFFQIGGHSVLAARMFARMEKVLGKALPLATLFQGPTIQKLAVLLRDSGWTPPWSCLVPIRPGGARPPFFFVHAIGGNVLSFAGFASHFDDDQPVYGLQAKGLDGQHPPNT